ncbi:MAG TPA: hypothetical protein VGK00_08745 [Anaerolineales bacterium]
MSTENSPSVAACEGCAQATLSALQTQERSGADAHAAATAEIMRANAQATLNAVSLTSSSALTQEKDNANVVAAQVAATAAIVNANAQATLASAGSTQAAAQTQDALRLTQVQFSQQLTAGAVTQSAHATLTQQNYNFLVASTQTGVADLIATQTQSALATSQWYADRSRQRAEQIQAPLTFLWLWCLPFFIVSIALVSLVFFWRWMKIRETQQRIDMLSDAPPVIIDHQPRSPNELVTPQNPVPLAHPTDHVGRWLDEAKSKLNAGKKDDDDNPDD